MAQSYQDYIKSLTPGGSTQLPVSKGTPIGLSGYVAPSTANSGSTAATPYQTPQQIVQQATAGIKPQSTLIPNQTVVPKRQNQTPVPQTYQDIINTATPGGSTLNYDVNQYRKITDPLPGFDQVQEQQKPDQVQEQPRVISSKESVGLAKDYGLKGLGKDNAYTGLTMEQANQKAAADKKMYQDSTSAGTSYTYNPQSISGFNDKSKQMNAKLDTVKNDAFTSSQQKKSDSDAIVKSYTNELAGLFSTPAEFQSALTSSPEIQKAVQDYQRAGGQLSDIASKILTVKGYRDNPDGTTTNYLSDGSTETGKLTQNPDGSYSFNATSNNKNTQTLDQYLGRISTPAEQKAYNALIPEQKAYQDQIAFEQSVPEQYKDLYFGTPDRVGILERERIVAQEKAKNLEEQALKKDITDRAKAELTIQKNQADLDEELATTEQNRLSARNYSTRMLAKMGALNTTGAAVEKLTSLEQRYQLQSQQLRTKYNFKAREIESNLNETLNDTEAKKQDAIIKLKEDLSKSEVEIAKEIMKLDLTASRETFKITDKYLSEYRAQKEKYVKEAKAEAEKNAKAAAKLASSYDISGLTFGNYVNQQQQGGQNTTIGGNSVVGGMQVTQGGQTFANPKSLFPDYLQALQGKNISLDTQSVLSGKKSFYSLAQGTKNKVEKELKALGITSDLLPEKSLSVKTDTSSTASDEEFIKQLEELTK